MDIQTAIKQRRSVRKFLPQAIEPEIIRCLLESAQWAPSACNIQGWRFIVVDDQKLKEKIVERGGTKFIKDAPLGILVAYDQRTENLEYQDHIQSAAAAIQNLLLTAYSKGLGGCYVCHLPRKKELKRIFNIPTAYTPVAYIALGYPAQESKVVPRRYGLNQLIGHNQFPATSITSVSTKKLLIKRGLRKIYYFLPAPFKKIIFPFVDRYFTKKFEN